MNRLHDDSHTEWFFAICVSLVVLIIIALGCYLKLISIHKTLLKQTQLMEIELKEIETVDQSPEPDSRLVVTAYTTKPGTLTALTTKPVPGWTCAVSRDMAHWLGGKVWIEGVGVRHVTDLTHERLRNRVDVLVGKRQEVASIGNAERTVIFLGKG